jgi:hypothetical protein
MKKIKIFFLIPLLFSAFSFSQVTNEGDPVSWSYSSNELSNIEPNILPSFDLQAVKDEDKTNDYLFDKPWRFGYMHSVDYGFEDGQWDILDNGDRIWRINIFKWSSVPKFYFR